MKKSKTTLEDGRYLIYYSFSNQQESSKRASQSSAKEKEPTAGGKK